MKTLKPDSTASAASLPVSVVQAWNDFWFRPADPTTLGVIRICAGLLVLYVHLVYTFDLQALFGKNAWLDLQTVTLSRLEEPIGVPADDWEATSPSLSPGTPEQLAYQQRWGVDPRLAYTQ